MVEIKSLIARLRRTMKDEDENSFTDTELLDYISDGVAFVRRVILQTNPEFIAVAVAKGELQAGENEVTLSSSVQQIVDVRIDGRKIKMENLNAIPDTKHTGRINCYCLLNRKRMLFFPVPQEKSEYEVIAVKQQPELTISDATPYNNDFDAAIFEYAVIRAGMGDMFQMSQELQVMSTVIEQVQNLIRIANDSEDNFVRGYY